MIIKIRNMHQPDLWFTRSDVTEFERREHVLCNGQDTPPSDRDFACLPDDLGDTGFCIQTVTINYGPNPGESWSCLARLGSVFVMNDNGKTIDRF